MDLQAIQDSLDLRAQLGQLVSQDQLALQYQVRLDHKDFRGNRVLLEPRDHKGNKVSKVLPDSRGALVLLVGQVHRVPLGLLGLVVFRVLLDLKVTLVQLE